jgi:polysaccharide export outer membrane protein
VAITITSGGEDQPTEPILARVSQRGIVTLPLIGEVGVAGIEPFEAGERIAAAAVERSVYRQPAVVLKVEEPAFNRVTVLGAVTKPGVTELPRGSSDVLSAVAAAGGFAKNASTRVEVMRQSGSFVAAAPGEGVVTASYSEPAGSTRPAALADLASDSPAPAATPSCRLDLAQANPARRSDYRVGDGDVVMVLPEEERVIHVSGLVNNPNQFKIPRNQDVHVLDAIAMAGGIKSPVADKVYVIRRTPNVPEPAMIEVSISRAKRDGNENLRLAGGDLVSVEQTPLTQFVDTMTTFFNVGLGLGGNVSFF